MLLLFSVFLLLHFILFVPNFWVNRNYAQILPVNEFKSKPKDFYKLIFKRWNPDFFRLNAELMWILVIGLIFQSVFNSTLLFYGIIPVYLFSFSVLSYHYLISGIFKRYPSWFNDWPQIKQGFTIAKHGFIWHLLGGILLLIVLIFFLVVLCLFFVSLIEQNNTMPLLVFCLVTLFVTHVYYWSLSFDPFRLIREFHIFRLEQFQVQYSVCYILANRLVSQNLKTGLEALKQHSGSQSDEPVTWKKKPDLAFIAMESYGAILYESKGFKNDWENFVEVKDDEIKSLGYQVHSGFLLPPVSGGNSWLSFFGLVKGITIPSDAVYQVIFNDQKNYNFPSIFNQLNLSNYATFWVSGIGGFKKMNIDWEAFKGFSGVQRILKYDDFKYNGPTFNIGPSAPDQFSLNKIMELVREKAENKPSAFFFETINSHYKFGSPTQTLDHWQDCQTANRKDFKPITRSKKNVEENYLKAIKYQWDSVLDLLKNQQDNPYVYVIFGDHQPPMITNPENSFKTPFHIITNVDLDKSYWDNLSFSSQLRLDLEETPTIKNEDFLNYFNAYMNS